MLSVWPAESSAHLVSRLRPLVPSLSAKAQGVCGTGPTPPQRSSPSARPDLASKNAPGSSRGACIPVKLSGRLRTKRRGRSGVLRSHERGIAAASSTKNTRRFQPPNKSFLSACDAFACMRRVQTRPATLRVLHFSRLAPQTVALELLLLNSCSPSHSLGASATPGPAQHNRHRIASRLQRKTLIATHLLFTRLIGAH